ncbi:MAG TPA: hypothetical protein VM737_08370 [Gemmatimonadota bacterium]|nr:hypothetical protein [Gemmatimonadota bacterium]
MRRVAFATWRSQPDLTTDDRLAVEPLARRGIRVESAVWSADGVEWASYDAVVLRSCWDYHLRRERFERWIARLESDGVPLINAPPLVRWNLDKRYLFDLAERGIPVEPTVWLERGTRADLAGLLRDRGWEEAVVKPAISASAHRTWRVPSVRTGSDGAGDPTSLDPATLDQALLDRMLRRSDVMVQRLNRGIHREGEWSLVFLGGEYSHAVVKRPRAGEFRVQERLGGTLEPMQPPAAIVRSASEALAATVDATAAVAATPVYARVDGVPEKDRLVVMEVELIEPSLFLAAAPGPADRFAAAIMSSMEPPVGGTDRAGRAGGRLNESHP